MHKANTTNMLEKISFKTMFLIVFFSLALRACFFIFSDGFNNPPIEDPLHYHKHAVSLVESGIFGGAIDLNQSKEKRKYIPTSSRPPGLPFLIAAVYKITNSTDYNYARLFLIFS